MAGREIVNPNDPDHPWFTPRSVMLGRAVDDSQKQEVMERLLEVWKANPFLRLGQLIGNVYHSTDQGGVSLYYAEDYALMTALEEAYRRKNDDKAE